MQKTPHCKICDQEGHYSYQCWRAKSQPIKSYKKLNSYGKYYKKWQETRKKWFEKNPPPTWDGYYICYLCSKKLEPKETTLDHIKPRGSNPKLRYVLSNLAPCCGECNIKKGSKKLSA